MTVTIPPEAKQLGESVRALRLGLSLSQQQLADKSGVSSTLVSRVERGGDVKLSNVVAIATALGVTLDELMRLHWETCPKCGGSGIVHTQQPAAAPHVPVFTMKSVEETDPKLARILGGGKPNFATGNGLSD